MKTIKDIFSKIIKFILKITGDDLSIYASMRFSVVDVPSLFPHTLTH